MTEYAAALTRVTDLRNHKAMHFDGTEGRARQIIAWLVDAQGRQVPPGHYRTGHAFEPAFVFQPMVGGTVLRVEAGWWVVERTELIFLAYSPEVFAKIYEILP